MAQAIKMKKEPRLDLKHNAFPFQAEAVDFAASLDYSAIFYEQGLGKTKIAIDLIVRWLGGRELDTILVVTKKGLIQNWMKEFDAHSYLMPQILTSDKGSNYSILHSPARVILCNYEAVAKESRLHQYLKLRNVGVIVDESAKIKNPHSAITEAFFSLSPLFKKRVIMTGTPFANRPEDIWAQIFFLDQGKALGVDYGDFKKGVNLSNSLFTDAEEQQEYAESLDSIFEKIKHFSIRETKAGSGLSLPNKVYQNIVCDWEHRQLELYHSIRQEEKYALIREGNIIRESSDEVLKRMLRLLQAASNPLLINEAYSQDPGKYAQLEILLSTISARGEKCIIWTSFVENAEWLFRRLKEYSPRLIHGGVPIGQRTRNVNSFQEEDSIRVLVAVPAAAKEGLTLTAANNVIFWDRSFSLDDYLQAQDRIHRISQTRICYVYNLLMENSIDLWVDSLLEAKEQSAKLAQQDISIGEYCERADYSFADVFRRVLGIGEKNG